MMTRQDFEALARALGSADDLYDAGNKIADVCAQSNPNFRRDKFLERIMSISAASVDLTMDEQAS